MKEAAVIFAFRYISAPSLLERRQWFRAEASTFLVELGAFFSQ